MVHQPLRRRVRDMNSSKRIFTLLILLLSVLVFSIATVTAVAVSESQSDITKHDDIQIEAKYKKISTNKIIFNSNGGKIGTKNTVSINVNNGAKIKKFPATPKRNGYTFKGGYTKKSSGKKISVNTKPTKSVTVYAQWTKKANTNKPRVLNAYEKALVGKYVSSQLTTSYDFKADGTLVMSCSANNQWQYGYSVEKANWAVTTKGTIQMTKRIEDWTDLKNPGLSYKNRAYADKNEYYIHDMKDGKLGIRISPRSLEDAKTNYFYVKM
ncbi:MAG: InlB B-repeat-containing protein [Methanobacteriaceae archaeon]|nr:InlB B-repeat-containing protein [Candidatus Methanorudis spinitermitis]